MRNVEAMLVLGEDRAAEILNVSVRTMQKWRVTGKGPTFRKMGGRVGYLLADLDEFINRSSRSSTSEQAAAAR